MALFETFTLYHSSVAFLMRRSKLVYLTMHVMNFSEVDPLLHCCANFVVHWIQIRVLGPEV